MPQVLGYSDRGALDLTSAPSNLKWLLDYYNKIAEHRIARQQNKVYAGKKGVSVQPIAPLLSTEWGQGVPYNNLCPAIDGTKCLTGCVATALAQVLYYYRFPLQGLGNHSYQYNSNKYEFDFENSIFEWGNMRDNYYPQIQYSEEQLNSVSMLMYACAISTEMQFGVEASGTPFTKIGPALSKNFGYGDAKMYERENHNNDWTSIIMNELGNKRPVIYSGGNANSSHAFIIDGVDKDGKFHINWGWDGECNGYFDLNSLDPINDGGYNSYQCMYVGYRDYAPISRLSMESITIEGSKVIDNMHVIKTIIKNSEIDFNGNFYLFVSERVDDIGICVDYKKIAITENESGTVTFNFTPQKAVSYYLRITADEQGKDVIGTRSLNIGKSSELISFADAEAKRICVMNWDSDGDGELNASEAADVKSIGNCFKDCDFNSFDEFKYFIHLKKIPEYAFFRCFNLKRITMPEGLERISEHAFRACEQLESLTIPRNVKQIDEMFISSTPCLTSIETDPDNSFYCSEDGVLYDKSKKSIIVFPPAKNISYFAIPQSVEQISGWAFAENKYLEEVSLSGSLKKIGSSAFGHCESLKSVLVPENVTSIDCNVWQYCPKLANAFIGKNVQLLKNNLFGGCKLLENIEVDPENDWFCSKDGILYSKDMIQLYHYPAGKKDSNYIMPNSVEGISCNAFEGSENLKSVTLSSKLSAIKEVMFKNAVGLESFIVPDWITEIGTNSFMGCVNLTNVTIPKSVTTLGDYVFDGCNKLTKIYSLIDSPYEISEIVFKSWTSNLYEQAILIVPQGCVEKYKSTSGWNSFKDIRDSDQIDYNVDNIIYEISGEKTVTIKSCKKTGLVEIAGTVVINGQTYNVTSIAENAFKDNTQITSVTIADGIATIGDNAFSGCVGLQVINTGKDVKSIGNKAFANVGTSPFAQTRSENSFTVNCYAESVPQTASDAFENSPISTGILLVNDNLVNEYNATYPWSMFGKIQGFNGAVGIYSISFDHPNTHFFDMQGNRHDKLQKGVNIIHLEDGNTKKVIVKY